MTMVTGNTGVNKVDELGVVFCSSQCKGREHRILYFISYGLIKPGQSAVSIMVWNEAQNYVVLLYSFW